MLDFGYPYLLFLLLLVPAFIVLYIMMRKARIKKLQKFGRLDVLKHLMPDVSKYKTLIKFSLLIVGLICLIFAVARPWGGVVNNSGQRTGMEVVIAVDASNSMLASATENQGDASRMTTAKVMLERLIGNLTNDRVGLVVFAGEAYQLIPTSSDFASAKSFLNSISPAEMPVQGTDIASAIKVAQSTFSKEKNVGKAIVLLTDAEELDDTEAALKAVKDAAGDGIQVDVIGVGSTQAVNIPYENGYFRDDEGNVVETKLNDELGMELAKAGKGVYVNASAGDAMSVLQRQLRGVRQSTFSAGKFVAHDELYFYFALAAFILLVVEAFIGYGKNKLFGKISFFSKGRSAGFMRKTKSENSSF